MGNMRCQEAFVVLLIFLSILGCGFGDDSSSFLKTKQDEVQTIAQAAQVNYVHTCELVSTCQSAQNCSRLECYPFQDQTSETTCVYVNNNTECFNKTGSTCNTVQANFIRGYVRTPPLDFTFVGGTQSGDRELYLGSSICAQRNLDSTFINVNNTLRSNSSLDYFYNLYFGAVDGSFRYYPGRELLSEACGSYDPRIRPWYTGATSILKDVVVLIDTGSAMQQTGFLDTSISYLERTKSLVKMLVKTLTEGDRVTVIPVNGSGSVGVQPFSQYNVPTNWDFTNPNFQGLLSYIVNNSALASNGGSNSNGRPTNFTDGFVEAASTFAGSSPSSSMQIIILMTNSQSQNTPSSADLAAANNLTTSGAKLFVYDLNPNTSLGWGTYACEDGVDPLLVSVNPLLWLSSYFSFLARARIAVSTGNEVFWQNPYTDASDLGEVITVAYPAMSSDGLQLIGVAGIDVQLAGLQSDPLLKQDVETLLTSSNYGQIAKNPNAGDLSNICSTKYTDFTSCGFTPGQSQSLCYPLAQPATDDELLSLLCCPECARKAKHRSIALWISLGVLGAVFVLLVLSIIYLLRRRRRREGLRRKKSFTMQDYSYETLRKATNGFDKGNIVGKGSFGVVYKASLGNETLAVKQLNQPADRAQDFEAEIKILGVTCHPNLVELKGTCFQDTQCFLVYEFLDSGDLHDWLWPPAHLGEKTTIDSESGPVRFLTWNRRRKIARGLARGLNYLHRGLEPNGTVFHLDIKPHNILLEYNFNPKIADFGISQLYEPGYTFQVASVVRGTFGYIAPEVLQGQVKPSSKLDVYSYGMVLLQLISGRKIDDPDCRPFLLQWARDHVDDGYVEKVVDENLIVTVKEEFKEALLANCKQLIMLALRCLSERPEVRPEMSDVLDIIDTLRDVADVQTPSFTDYDSDHNLDSQHFDNTIDETNLPISGCLIPFSGGKEFDGPFQQLKSESESMQGGNAVKNSEILTPLTSSERTAAGDNNQSSGSKDRSSVHGRSSVDSSLKRTLEMGSVQSEPKIKSFLQRSTSLS